MAEALINKTEGVELTPTECCFCESRDNVKAFGVITSKIGNSYKFKFFGACTKHMSKINKILSGQVDIDVVFDKTKDIEHITQCNLRSLL